MNPGRLIDAPGEGLEVRLLRSARVDELPPGALERAAAAAGLVGLALPPLSAVDTVEAATEALHAGGSLPSASVAGAAGLTGAGSGTAVLVSKYIGLGMAIGLGVSVGLVGFKLSSRSAPATPAVTTLPSASPRMGFTVDTARRSVLSLDEAPPDVLSLDQDLSSSEADRSPEGRGAQGRARNRAKAHPAAPAARGSSTPRAETAPGPSGSGLPDASELAREVAQLDRARAFLRAGRASAALRELEQHAQGPRHALATEAAVLRAEAWLQQGRTADAARLARQLLEAGVSGHQAVRLRRIAGGTN